MGGTVFVKYFGNKATSQMGYKFILNRFQTNILIIHPWKLTFDLVTFIPTHFYAKGFEIISLSMECAPHKKLSATLSAIF